MHHTIRYYLVTAPTLTGPLMLVQHLVKRQNGYTAKFPNRTPRVILSLPCFLDAEGLTQRKATDRQKTTVSIQMKRKMRRLLMDTLINP